MNVSPYVEHAASQTRSERDFWKSTGLPYGKMLQARDKIEEAEALIQEILAEVESNSDEGRSVHGTGEDLAQCISSEIIGQFLPAMERALNEWLAKEDEK